jgi:peptide/nickel transport system substrate-binding protein
MNKRILTITLTIVVVGLLVAACAGAAPTQAPPATSVPPAPTQAPTLAPAAAQPTQAPTTAPAAAQPTQAPTTAPAATAATAAGAPKPGGQVIIGYGQEPDRFWSPFSGLTVSYELGDLMDLPLLQIDNKLQFVPKLITEVPTTANGDISADGLSIKFPLRQDVKWQDGKDFTSADVKFTWQVIMMPGTDVTGHAGWDQITDVQTPDPYTAIFKFKTIDAAFLSQISLVGMLPQHLLSGKAADEINKDPWFRAPVGTGPFMFKEWVPGDHITLVKNPNYFEPGKPYLDTIIWKIIPDSNALVNQLQTGDIDMALRLSDTDAETADTFSKVTRVSDSTVSPWLIWVNDQAPGLNDPVVRQALSYGLDRQGITQQLLKGLLQPAYSYEPPDSWAYDPNLPKYEFNIDKANQILDAAGWAKGADGIREKNGVKLSFKIENIAGQQERIQILTTVAQTWKQIGVDAQLDLVDVGTLFGNMLPKDKFQMAYSYSGLTADPDLSTMYFCPQNNPSGNYGRYCNTQVDQYIKDELATFDQAKRKDALWKAQELIAQDVPYLYLAWRADHTVFNKRIHGYLPCPGYIELWNAQDWYVDQ